MNILIFVIFFILQLASFILLIITLIKNKSSEEDAIPKKIISNYWLKIGIIAIIFLALIITCSFLLYNLGFQIVGILILNIIIYSISIPIINILILLFIGIMGTLV